MPERVKPYLEAEKVMATVALLQRRIEERFPGSGLGGVAARLHQACARSQVQIEWLGRPILPLRITSIVLTGVLVAGLVIAVWELADDVANLDVVTAVSAVESAINDAVFVGIAVLFAWGFEVRMKRNRALAAIHELRSLAHVIDMHQLTKDPDRILRPGGDTRSSPRRTMSAHQLRRYLDYCSELLALTGKVAVLYIQDFDDSTVLASANEVEILTTGLSRKIWQKLMILDGSAGTAPPAAA